MVATVMCESGGRQYNESGGVVMGKVTPDMGVMQISLKHHKENAERLGYDLTQTEDNVAYGRLLYDEAKARGVDPMTPWYCAHKSHLALLR